MILQLFRISFDFMLKRNTDGNENEIEARILKWHLPKKGGCHFL